jgi:hypothetical protein
MGDGVMLFHWKGGPGTTVKTLPTAEISKPHGTHALRSSQRESGRS